MNPGHEALLAQLRAAGGPTSSQCHERDSYGGSGHLFYNVSVPARRAIAKRWLAAHRAITDKEFLALVESLFGGESHEEKTLAACLLSSHAKARRAATPGALDRWLGLVNGWAEVDCLCQNLFTAEEMACDWSEWKGLIESLSTSANINKRRAAMVLLNGPVHYTDDLRFADLALAVIERLKAERAILITKAVSWLLRSMVTRHRELVGAYLAEHSASLPSVAVRETQTKLATGTKSGLRKF